MVSVALHPAPANADNSDDDDPGFSVDGRMPGVEQWPPVCSSQPLAGSLHYDPGSGTWARPNPEPAH
jgi:hypothetical protein